MKSSLTKLYCTISYTLFTLLIQLLWFTFQPLTIVFSNVAVIYQKLWVLRHFLLNLVKICTFYSTLGAWSALWCREIVAPDCDVEIIFNFAQNIQPQRLLFNTKIGSWNIVVFWRMCHSLWRVFFQRAKIFASCFIWSVILQ